MKGMFMTYTPLKLGFKILFTAQHTHTHKHFTALWMLGHMQISISPQTDNHASISPLSFFYGK